LSEVAGQLASSSGVATPSHRNVQRGRRDQKGLHHVGPDHPVEAAGQCVGEGDERAAHRALNLAEWQERRQKAPARRQKKHDHRDRDDYIGEGGRQARHPSTRAVAKAKHHPLGGGHDLRPTVPLAHERQKNGDGKHDSAAHFDPEAVQTVESDESHDGGRPRDVEIASHPRSTERPPRQLATAEEVVFGAPPRAPRQNGARGDQQQQVCPHDEVVEPVHGRTATRTRGGVKPDTRFSRRTIRFGVSFGVR
jgi:hypothetical protein